MKTQVEGKENPVGGVERAGEGAFSPTPNEQPQIKKVWIDLSDLYRYMPHKPAYEILNNILGSYKYIEVVALVNIDDTGNVVVKDYEGIVERIFKEEDGDLEELEEKAAVSLAKRMQRDEITIVELLDGYEAAIAFIVREVVTWS